MRHHPAAVPLTYLGLTVGGALALAAGIWVAPPLGSAIMPEPLRFWPEVIATGLARPEPVEFLRYGLLVAVPVAVAAVLVLTHSQPWAQRLGERAPARALARVLPVAIAAALAVAWFAREEPDLFPTDPRNYFGDLHGLLAVSIAVAAVLAAASPRCRARWASLSGSRPTLAAALLLAAGATLLLLLPAVFTDRSLAGGPRFVNVHLPYYVSDYAALDAGTAPLVDHANHYAHLLPYALSPLLDSVDYSPGAFTALLTGLSALCFLLLFRVLALTTGSPLGAAALYALVLGLATVTVIDEPGGVVNNANVYSVLPERYLGPCIVAWLCARHFRGLRPSRPAVIVFAAGLAVVNNPEFGGPVLIAALAGCLVFELSGGRRLGPALRALALEAAVGLGAGIAAVCALTLIAQGALPDPALLTYFSRLSGLQGFVLIPLPAVGLWWAVYAAFAGALLIATLRALARERDRALTGMLAFAGMFGLLAGAFYVGRSDKFTMTALFPIWGLALALLACHVLARLAGERGTGWRALARAGPLGLAVLAGLSLGASRYTDPPSPWGQIQRLSTSAPGITAFGLAEETAFVAGQTQAEEPVVILRENSDVIARAAGVRNVSPLSEPFHILSEEQLETVLEELSEAGGSVAFTGEGLLFPFWSEILDALRERGFQPVARSPSRKLTMWVR